MSNRAKDTQKNESDVNEYEREFMCSSHACEASTRRNHALMPDTMRQSGSRALPLMGKQPNPPLCRIHAVSKNGDERRMSMARKIHGNYYEDTYCKHECQDCKRCFILDDVLSENMKLICPYCGSSSEITWIAVSEDEEDMDIARQSAEYLLDIRKEDDKDSLFLDVMSLIFVLAKFSMKHNEIISYLEIRKYCRNAGHGYPPSLDDVAANPDAFGFYCKQLMYYLVELWRD